MWARWLSLTSSAALGLGLAGWLAAGGLAATSLLARRKPRWAACLTLWERRAVGWALVWLALGLVVGAGASQEMWGRVWRWAPREGWALIAALAAMAYGQASSGLVRRMALAAGVVAALLALAAGALLPDWPRLP